MVMICLEGFPADLNRRISNELEMSESWYIDSLP
jgi:hypothetical protein